MAKEFEIVLKCKGPSGHPLRVTTEEGEVWQVEGECHQCGKCCHGCINLKAETLNGKKLNVCSVYWERPARCLIWPYDPSASLEEGCGYSWKRIK
jgi:hypothetical protein